MLSELGENNNVIQFIIISAQNNFLDLLAKPCCLVGVLWEAVKKYMKEYANTPGSGQVW